MPGPLTGGAGSANAANPLTVYAAGAEYTLTGSFTELDFGTTDPALVINQPGTYLILARVMAAIHSDAPDDLSFKLRRTNNTAADISNSSTFVMLLATGGDAFYSEVSLPPVLYTTAGTTDSISIFGHANGVLNGGFVTEASIVAIRLY